MPTSCNLLDWNHTPALCHPERSLAKREAIRQTKSKDPYQLGITLGDARDFRVVTHFFDEHETQPLSIFSRDATACESPTWKRRNRSTSGDEPGRDVTLALFTTRQ